MRLFGLLLAILVLSTLEGCSRTRNGNLDTAKASEEKFNDHYVFYGAVSVTANSVCRALDEQGIGYVMGQCGVGMCDLWVDPDKIEKAITLIGALPSEGKGPVFVSKTFPRTKLKASRERVR